MCRRCHLCIAPATAHSGRRAAANPEVITTNTSDKIIARTTDSGLRPSAGPGMTAADCGTGVIYGQRRHLCACDVIYAWPQPRYHSGVRPSTDPRMTGCGSRNARHLWTEPSSMHCPNHGVVPGRRAAASPEPITTNLSDQTTTEAYGFRAPAYGRPRNDTLRIWKHASSMRRVALPATPPPQSPAPRTAA